jgi:hypothetical protein
MKTKQYISFAILILLTGTVFAQKKDTTKRIEITSAFRPVLKESAKINFNASPAVNDTTKQPLTYDIPNQNLLFAYQPGQLRPLALDIDSGGRWDMESYIKAGFGSLKTPFIQAGISFGDGKSAGLNIHAKHVSSDGKRQFQDFSNTNIGLRGFFQTAKNMEWTARLGTKQDKYYQYGFEPQTLVLPQDSVLKKYQTYYGALGFHNMNLTSFGLSYSPEVRIDVFNDNLNNKESNTYVDVPLQKTVGKVFAVNLGVTFDLTRYKPGKFGPQDNTFYYISPSILFKTPNVNIQAGIRPSWDNKTFKMFPNVMAEISSPDKRFTFQAGWIGYLRKTSYQWLVSQNPWIEAPSTLKNTWIEERYAGIKGSIGDHFSYSTKVGWNKYNNHALYANDQRDGRTFEVLYEPKMNAVHVSGEMGYTVEEKFSVLAGFRLNQYFSLQQYHRAWGLVPLELNAAMRVQVMKDLWIKSDFFAWGGSRYRTKEGATKGLNGAIDLNAGLEFRITKNINLWAQFNNIMNKEYQRWNQYPSYGFSFLGGVIFVFDQKMH